MTAGFLPSDELTATRSARTDLPDDRLIQIIELPQQDFVKPGHGKRRSVW